MTDSYKRLDVIGNAITYVITKISQVNSLGFTDANKTAEDFFCSILNILNGYRLQNLNLQRKNHAGLDLGDSKRKIGFQITSETSRQGLLKKVEAIGRHQLHKKYSTIFFLLLDKKRKYKSDLRGSGFTLKVTNIMDHRDLLENVNQADDKTIGKLYDFVIREIPAIDPALQSPKNPYPTGDHSEYLDDLDFPNELRNQYNPKIALDQLQLLKAKRWGTATPKYKYKLLATQGICHLELYEEKQAALLFVEAYQYDQENDRAIFFRAFAGALLGEKDLARKLIQTLLQKNPFSVDAHIVLIQLEMSNANYDAVISMVPAAIQDISQIAYSLATYAKGIGKLKESIQWYEKSLEKPPVRKADLQAGLGSIIIEQATNIFEYVTNQYDPENIASVKRGVELISQAWSEVKHSDLKKTRLIWLSNLAVGKRLLGKNEEALHLIREAAQISPENPDILKLFGSSLFINSRMEESLAVLQQCRELEPHSFQVNIMIAEILIRLNRTAEAMPLLEELLKKEKEPKEIEDATVAMINALIKSGNRDKAVELAIQGSKDLPSKIRFKLAQAEIYQDEGKGEESKRVIDEAKKLVNDKTENEEIHDLAKALFKRKEYKDSYLLLEKIVNRRALSSLSQLLITAYVNADEHQKAIVLCNDIEGIHGKHEFITDIKAYIYADRLEYDKASGVCEEYLTSYPGTQRIILRLCHIYRVSHNKSRLREILKTLTVIDEWPIETRFMIANFFLDTGDYWRALAVSYKAWRENLSSPLANQLYYITNSHLPNDFVKEELMDLKVVRDDTQLRLLHEQSKQYLDVHIIANDDAKLRPQDFSVDEPLPKILIGRSIDTTVDYNGGTYRIVSIVSKYIAACHETLNLLSTIHADFSGFRSFQLPEERTGDVRKDFKPLFDQVDRFAEVDQKIYKYYFENLLPVGALSKFRNVSTIKTYGWLSSSPDFGIISIGLPNEIEAAKSKIRSGAADITVDVTSLMFFHTFNQLDLLLSLKGKIFIAQASVDEFLNLIEEYQSSTEHGGYIGVGKIDGRYVNEIVSPEDLSRTIEKISQTIQWINSNATIFSSDPEPNMSTDMKRNVEDAIGKTYFDTLTGCVKNKSILLSDDERFRALARSENQVTGISTYVFLCLLVDKKILALDQFNQLTLNLIFLNYRNIPVNDKLIWLAAEKTVYKIAPPLTIALNSLGHQVSTLESSAEVAANFFKIFYVNINLRSEREKMVGYVLQILFKGRNKAYLKRLLSIKIESRFSMLQPQKDHLLGVINSWSKFL